MTLALDRVADRAGEQHPRRWAALVVLCAAALIINVDNTILNVALPTLVRELHASSSELQWIVDSYAMVFAGLLLVGGSLADRFGRRRFFLIGLTVFAGGSIGAARSGSVDLLIACRAVMGAGAALTIPSSLSIVNDVFRDPRSGRKLSGPGVGRSDSGSPSAPSPGGSSRPILVGLDLLGECADRRWQRSSARWCWSRARRTPPRSARSCGAVLSIAGLGFLLWAIIEAPTRGWTSPAVVASGLAAVVILGSFVAWEAHCRHPMLKLSFFSDRRFSIAAAAECLGTFGLMGALFLQTQFLQFKLGDSPLQAGLRILPMAAMLVASAALAATVARLIGLKLTVAAGLAAVAAGLWQISAASSAATTYGDVVPGLLLLGLGAGLLLPTATDSVVGSVPQGDSGMGSASNAVALQVVGPWASP